MTLSHLEYYDFSHPDVFFLVVCQEEQISPVEGWLHRTGQDHDDGRLGTGGNLKKRNQVNRDKVEDCSSTVNRDKKRPLQLKVRTGLYQLSINQSLCLCLLLRTINPFHIISADDTIIPNERT